MKKMFDFKDLQIISCLRNNSRQSMKKMSKTVKLPISTIYDRIKKLEKNGLIQKYTVIIDFKKMEHPIKANIFIKTDVNKEKFENCAVSDSVTNNVTKLTGDEYDYVIEGVFTSMDKLSQYLEKITKSYGVLNYKIYYTINELKKECFMIEDKIGLRKICPISA